MTHEVPSDQVSEEPGDIEQTVLVPRVSHNDAREASTDVEPDLDVTIVRLIEPAAPHRESVASIVEAPLPTAPQATAPQPPAPRSASAESVPAPARVPAPSQSPALAPWSVRVRGTTAVVPLDVPVVVGRRPSAQRVAEHPPPRRIVIPADRGDVSGRHARLEQLGDSLVVTDLGSTNGIVVHWSSGSRSRLRPGESCALLPDAVVVLGEGVELEFLASDEASLGGSPRTTF